MRDNGKIVAFFTGSDVFSNFFMRKFKHKGHWMECSEQAFMWEKVVYFNGENSQEAKDLLNSFEIFNSLDRNGNKITRSMFPSVCKKMGRSRKIKFVESEWDKVRYDIMVEILKSKYDEECMRDVLLSTKDMEIVEASPYDIDWGVGIDINDDRIFDEGNWEGDNLLGKALMEVRDYYK